MIEEHILKNKIKKTVCDQLKYFSIMKRNEALRRADHSDEEDIPKAVARSPSGFDETRSKFGGSSISKTTGAVSS